MPHALLEDPKAILGKFVAAKAGEIKAMAITYAYGKLDEIYQKLLNSCPPPKELEQLTKTLTTLKGVITSYKQRFSKLEPLPSKLDPVVAAGKVVVEILSHMPIPSTIGTPPGPAGGVIVSIPTGVIQAQANTLVWTRKAVEIMSTEKKDMQAILGGAKNILDPIFARIEQLEALLKRCIDAQAAGDNLTKAQLDSIRKASSGLDGGLTSGDDLGESYVGRNGKAYTLFVINDPDSPGVAPRRQAVAKDFRGIVVLKGPLSFAGSSKILKDELKLRIDNQLP